MALGVGVQCRHAQTRLHIAGNDLLPLCRGVEQGLHGAHEAVIHRRDGRFHNRARSACRYRVGIGHILLRGCGRRQDDALHRRAGSGQQVRHHGGIDAAADAHHIALRAMRLPLLLQPRHQIIQILPHHACCCSMG